MSLGAEELSRTRAELAANLARTSLTRAEVAADLAFDEARLDAALNATGSGDPSDVWLLRDYIEQKRAEKKGKK